MKDLWKRYIDFIGVHLSEEREGYWEHLLICIRISFYLWLAAMAALVHGICPGILGGVATRMVGYVNEALGARDLEKREPPRDF